MSINPIAENEFFLQSLPPLSWESKYDDSKIELASFFYSYSFPIFCSVFLSVDTNRISSKF